jgi:hypothetical protein
VCQSVTHCIFAVCVCVCVCVCVVRGGDSGRSARAVAHVRVPAQLTSDGASRAIVPLGG